MHKHAQVVARYCKKTLDLSNQINAYSYRSLSICIIDCVYSLRAQYESTTKKVVIRYAEKYMHGDINAQGDNLTDLISNIENAGGPSAFAKEILKNQQTSGGVIKSEVCLNLARYLRYIQINTMEDFKKFECPELLEIVIRAVKGMGNAGTNYLFMLAGDPNRCKPDTHIHHFLRDACKDELNKDAEIQTLFREVAGILASDYPSLTVSMLDGIIWRKYQIANKEK